MSTPHLASHVASHLATPWSDLEARLAGPQGGQARQDLISALEAQSGALQKSLASMTLGRGDYALSEAYADAVDAALGFLLSGPPPTPPVPSAPGR